MFDSLICEHRKMLMLGFKLRLHYINGEKMRARNIAYLLIYSPRGILTNLFIVVENVSLHDSYKFFYDVNAWADLRDTEAT